MLENTHSSRSSSRRSESTTCREPSHPPTQNRGTANDTHTEQNPSEVSLEVSCEVSPMGSLEVSPMGSLVVSLVEFLEEKHRVPSREYR